MNGGDEVVAASAPAGPPQPLEWKFSQVFGERTAGEEVQEGNLFFPYVVLCCVPCRIQLVVLGLGFVSMLLICFGSCFGFWVSVQSMVNYEGLV